AREQLLQIHLGVGVGLAEFLLQDRSFRFIAACFTEPGEQANGMNNLLFLKRHRAADGAAGGTAATPVSEWDAAEWGHAGITSVPGTFRCCDQLSQLLRIVRKLLEFGS